jgi:hypothetical protein
VHVLEPEVQLYEPPLPSADEFTAIAVPAVALAVLGPDCVTLRVTAAALSSVPVPFGPLYVRMRKLSTPSGAPMPNAHETVVPLLLHVGGAALKICGVPPLTLTVKDCVFGEIVAGLRTVLATIACEAVLALAPPLAPEVEYVYVN